MMQLLKAGTKPRKPMKVAAAKPLGKPWANGDTRKKVSQVVFEPLNQSAGKQVQDSTCKDGSFIQTDDGQPLRFDL